MTAYEASEPLAVKQPCETCGGSASKTLYSSGWAKCFKCGESSRHDEEGGDTPKAATRGQKGLIALRDYESLDDRCLTRESCVRWGYGMATTYQGTDVQVAQYWDKEGTRVVAQKLRAPDKRFVWVGSREGMEPLFGMHKWKTGGKKVVVTEGEIDAITVSQLQQHQWPVVSLPDGAGTAKHSIAAALEWLDTFQEVVLMFDMDAPGRKAVEEAAEVLAVGKAFIAELPRKDANDCLKAGLGKEVINAIWNARPWRPDAILDNQAVWERMETYEGPQGVEVPWPLLRPMFPMIPLKRITTILAGTGSGKTTFVKQLEAAIIKAPDPKMNRIGVFHFEEDVVETALGIMGAADRKQEEQILKMSKDMRKELYAQTAGREGVFYYDSFGSLDPEIVMRKIRYLVKAEGIRYVVIDHLSIMLSGLAVSNERKAIDVVMTQLRQLVEELKIGLILISHLTKADGGKSHEEGEPIKLRDARGSQAIAQLTDVAVALERNQQADDTYLRNLITVRILKNRPWRLTGVACKLYYDHKDGSMTDFPATYMENPEDEFSDANTADGTSVFESVVPDSDGEDEAERTAKEGPSGTGNEPDEADEDEPADKDAPDEDRPF